MGGVVKAMDAAMKSMNLEKISSLMDKFENQFEDLDVQSSYMDNTMSQSTTTAVPQGDVENLLQQVADEAGYAIYIIFLNINYIYHVCILCYSNYIFFSLELKLELPTNPQSLSSLSSTTTEQDELTQRLARLRQAE